MRFVEHRIGDQRVLRLIRKWLKAGVVEDGVRRPAVKGTPQGAVISPLLANIYLHYVYELWVEQWRKRHARGAMIVVRYADGTVVGFDTAPMPSGSCGQYIRMAEFALELHPDKTRLIELAGMPHPTGRHGERASRKPSTSSASPISAHDRGRGALSWPATRGVTGRWRSSWKSRRSSGWLC